MHFWNEKFGNMQEVKIDNKDILLLFFERLSFWEKYAIFYDQSSKVFWIARTTSLPYRIIVFIFGMLITFLYGIFLLFMAIISLDIFHQAFWNDLKKDIEDYKQEVRELLFPEKYGQFYSFWVTEQAGNRYMTLKSFLHE